MGPSNIAMLCVLIILLILSAFFSSAETALTTVNRVRIRMLLEEGNKSAKVLTEVLEKMPKMLSTVLIGNNIVNLSASAVATLFTQKILEQNGVKGNIGALSSIGVGILTFVLIIFGEIVPKTIATVRNEQISLKYARIIKFLMIIFTPIIFVVNLFSSLVLKIFRIDVNLNSKKLTTGELRTIMDVSQEEGILESEEIDMINNVFDFGDTSAKDIMVPKVDITMVSIDTTYKELLNIVKDVKFTRMPVYKDSSDNIVGIINIKDMIINEVTQSDFDITSLMRDPIFTIATKELNDLLIEMKENDAGMCIVLDEYGAVDGMITLEDILEEIVGELRDEFDEAEEEVIKQLSDDRYLVEGSVNLDDFNDVAGTNIDSENYESIGGLIIEKLERVPKNGDIVIIDNCKLTVVKMDKNRIESVMVDIITHAEKDENQNNNDNDKE